MGSDSSRWKWSFWRCTTSSVRFMPTSQWLVCAPLGEITRRYLFSMTEDFLSAQEEGLLGSESCADVAMFERARVRCFCVVFACTYCTCACYPSPVLAWTPMTLISAFGAPCTVNFSKNLATWIRSCFFWGLGTILDLMNLFCVKRGGKTAVDSGRIFYFFILKTIWCLAYQLFDSLWSSQSRRLKGYHHLVQTDQFPCFPFWV